MPADVLIASPPRVDPARIVKFVLVLVLAVLVLIPVVIAARAGKYSSTMDDPLAAFGLWGTFVIHMATRPGRREAAATVLLGVLFRSLYDVTIGERGYFGSALIGFGSFVGLASVLVLGVRAFQLSGEARTRRLRALGVCGIFFYMGVSLIFYISFAKLVLPHKLDLYLYQFDASMGFQASFAAGRLFDSSRVMLQIGAMTYNSLGLLVAAIYAIHANGRWRVNVLKLIVINSILGFSLYFIYPAAGPKYAFPTYPVEPGRVQPQAITLSAAPNAMPSLHFGTALVIFWLARPWKWLRAACGVFLALTGLATLGLGEHYLVDLVVAAPYALTLLAAAADVKGKVAPFAAGAAMVGSWLYLLHRESFPPALSWLLVLSTVFVSIYLERKLAEKWMAPAPDLCPK